MIEVRANFRIVLRGPILTQSTRIGAHGLDAVAARNHLGLLYLPHSLVKGCLRDSACELGFLRSKKKQPLALGGAEDLTFTDFVAEDTLPPAEASVIARAALDEDSRAAAPGQLRFLECPVLPGDCATFSGFIAFYHDKAVETECCLEDIHRALSWIEAMGSDKSTGFGRVVRVDQGKVKLPVDWAAPIGRPAEAAVDDDRLWLPLTIRVHESFCTTSDLVKGNIYESSESLSGAVVKGAIAGALQRGAGLRRGTDLADPSVDTGPWSGLCRALPQLRVLTGYPSHEQVSDRPVVRPRSLVTWKRPENELKECEEKNGRPVSLVTWKRPENEPGVADVAQLDGPCLIECAPPAFWCDWKDSGDAVRKNCAEWMSFPESPLKETRVRTAIDPDRRRAKDEDLFAYQMCVPADADDPEKPLVWRGAVGLHNVPQDRRPAVLRQLRAFFDCAVLLLGKDDAEAEVEVSEPIPSLNSGVGQQPVQGRDPAVWVIALQSPAVMIDPFALNESDQANPRNALFDQYSEYFKRSSGGELSLKRYFSEERLVSRYQAWHHRRHDQSDTPRHERPYNPILLTEAGSVFVLQAEDADAASAQSRIDGWLRDGLPLPGWAVQYRRPKREASSAGCRIDVPIGVKDPLTFRDLPYLPSNGYGEIAVNLPCHERLKPRSDLVEVCHGI